MAVELATAYLSLVPSLRGLQANLERELKPVAAAAGKSGEDAGRALGSGLAAKTRPAAEKAGTDSGEGFVRHFRTAASGLAGAMGLGIAAAGVAIVTKQVVDAASAESSAQARLANALKQTGSSYEAHRDQVEKTVHDYELLGYSGDETQNALSRLVTATKNPTKAIADLGLAANLAAARHIDLDTAATLVGRVATGNTGILARFGISLNVASGNAKALETAHRSLATAQLHLATIQDTLHAKQGVSAVDLEKLRIAELNLSTVRESLAGKTKLTTAEQSRLASAQLRVTTIQDTLTQKTHLTVAERDRLTAAEKAVADAQAKVTATTGASSSALGQLGKMFGGAASSQAQSFAGRIRAMRAEMVDTFARIGLTAAPAVMALFTALQPILRVVVALVPPLARLVTLVVTGLTVGIRNIVEPIMAWVRALQQGHTWAILIAAAVAGAALGIGVAFLPVLTTLIAETLVSAGAFLAQAAAMAAAYAPFIAIGVAAAAVAAGIYYLIRLIIDHWDAITGFFVHTWNTIWPYLKTWGPVALAVLVPFIGIPLLIFQHWSQITGFLARVWNLVWPYLKTWGPVALAVLVPFIGIPLLIWQHFSQITGFLAKAWNAAYNTVKSWIDTIVGYVGGLPAKIAGIGGALVKVGTGLMTQLWHGLTSAGGAIADFARSVVNDIIDGLNTVLPHHIQLPKVSVGPVHLSLPDIPLFPNIPHIAAGGMTLGQTLAVVGDNPSGNELVAPLDSPRTRAALATAFTSALRSLGAGTLAAAGAGGPAVLIEDAHFDEPVDVDMLLKRADFHLTTRRL